VRLAELLEQVVSGSADARQSDDEATR
jgi:hypothetical protein